VRSPRLDSPMGGTVRGGPDSVDGSGPDGQVSEEREGNNASNTGLLFGEDEVVTERPIPENGKQSGYTLDFNKWWDIYPRKAGKRKAFQAFKAALRRVDLTELMKKTTEFAQSDKGTGDQKFIPHAATWLNGDRWLDDPSEWREYGKRDLGQYEKEFNAWFAYYPKQTGRDEAIEAWADLMEQKELDVPKALSAVQLFAKSQKGLSQYCPSAASWLKQKWFNDNPSRWNDTKQSARQTTRI